MTSERDSFSTKVQTLEQNIEELKLALSEKQTELQGLEEMLKTQKESHGRILRTLENKNSSLKKDYDAVNVDLQEVKKEFEAYKVKVHTMLKKEKNTPKAMNKEKESDKETNLLKVRFQFST